MELVRFHRGRCFPDFAGIATRPKILSPPYFLTSLVSEWRLMACIIASSNYLHANTLTNGVYLLQPCFHYPPKQGLTDLPGADVLRLMRCFRVFRLFKRLLDRTCMRTSSCIIRAHTHTDAGK